MGAWQEIADYTFTTNETSYTFTNFGTITKDDFVKVVFLANSTAGSQFGLFPNTTAGVSGNETGSNYTRQGIFAIGTSLSADRSAKNVVNATNVSQSLATIYVKISENGKWNTLTNYTNFLSGSIAVDLDYVTSHNLTFNDPITSLTLKSTATNAIGTGSRIQIYKLAAEKVADITVDTNSTQVNIPLTGVLDPAIDKDSEYLLVSDVEAAVNQTGFNLFVNDNTTLTNYYSQGIFGNGSSAVAERLNQGRMTYLSAANQKSLIYSHIKLSNIGAYTSQNYVIRVYGTNGLLVENQFVSSTAENITSITKLNIVTTTTNGISAGSRFMLYKLY